VALRRLRSGQFMRRAHALTISTRRYKGSESKHSQTLHQEAHFAPAHNYQLDCCQAELYPDSKLSEPACADSPKSTGEKYPFICSILDLND